LPQVRTSNGNSVVNLTLTPLDLVATAAGIFDLVTISTGKFGLELITINAPNCGRFPVLVVLELGGINNRDDITYNG
jgi:hypothetical protein